MQGLRAVTRSRRMSVCLYHFDKAYSFISHKTPSRALIVKIGLFLQMRKAASTGVCAILVPLCDLCIMSQRGSRLLFQVSLCASVSIRPVSSMASWSVSQSSRCYELSEDLCRFIRKSKCPTA